MQEFGVKKRTRGVVFMPIYAGMNFPGDLPNNGFIYTDENGKDRFFVISQSGEDGSLGFSEEEL